jgi:TPR repeat protein
MPQQGRCGDSDYKAALAEMAKNEPQVKRATFLLRSSVRKGNASAAYALATWYLFGQEPCIKKDFIRAAQLLKLAAAADLPEALYDLGVSYELGQGLKKNLKLAFRHYLRAALRGDGDAIFAVGRCLYWGIGVSADRGLAAIWYERAKQLGTYVDEDYER